MSKFTRAFISFLMHLHWNDIIISCVFWLQKLTGHLEEMLQAAYNKFQAWQTRRMMRKTWGDRRWKIEKTLSEFKEKGEEQTKTRSPILGRLGPDGWIFQPIRAGGASEHVCLGEGLEESKFCHLIGPLGDGLRQSQITVIIYFSLYSFRLVFLPFPFFFFQWIISFPR